MADNVAITAGTGTTIGADEISSVKYQRVKLIHGADGTNDGDVSNANGLPVKPLANSGVDIGDVDVTSVIPGVGATNLGKAEDAAHSSGDVGVMSLAVRADTPAATGANGDYCPVLVDASGLLHTVISAALPAGTAAIGKLAANTGVDIGDVDVTSIVPGSGATNLGKAEDSVAGSGDVGVMALAVRADTPAATGANGDYVPMLTNSTGCLHTEVSVALPAGTNAIGKLAANSGVDIGDVDITSILPGVGATNLGKAEDAVAASGDVGVMALAVRSDTPAATAADGDYHPVLVNSSGLLHTVISAALPAGTAAIGKLAANNGVDIGDVDVASVVPGTGATNLGKAEDAGHTTGDVGVMMLAVRQDSRAALAGTTGDYIPPTTDALGQMRVVSDYMYRVAVSKTRPNDTNTYAAGDVINEDTGAGTVYTFTGMGLQNGGGGVITNVKVIDGSAQSLKAVLELWLFDTTITSDNDNGAFTPTDAELATLVSVIPMTQTFVGDATSGAGGNCVYSSGDIAVEYVCATGATSLFGVLVVRNAYIPTANETFNVIISAIQA